MKVNIWAKVQLNPGGHLLQSIHHPPNPPEPLNKKSKTEAQHSPDKVTSRAEYFTHTHTQDKKDDLVTPPERHFKKSRQKKKSGKKALNICSTQPQKLTKSTTRKRPKIA